MQDPTIVSTLEETTLTALAELGVAAPDTTGHSDPARRAALLALLHRAVAAELHHATALVPAAEETTVWAALDSAAAPGDPSELAALALRVAQEHLTASLPATDTTHFGQPSAAGRGRLEPHAEVALLAVEAAQTVLAQRDAPSHAAAYRTGGAADLARRLHEEATKLTNMHLDAALDAASRERDTAGDLTFSWQVEGHTCGGDITDYARDWEKCRTNSLHITPTVLTWTGARHTVEVQQSGHSEAWLTYRLSVLGTVAEAKLSAYA
ncbi:hypothetical protein ACWGIR_22825 [Streptomyces albidoflavus]